MRARFNKRFWHIKTVRPLALTGDFACSTHGETEKTRLIELSSDLRKDPQQLIITLVHEMMHASFPYLDEETIAAAGYDVGMALYKLGVRARMPRMERKNDAR